MSLRLFFWGNNSRLAESGTTAAAFRGFRFIRLRSAAAFTAIAPEHAIDDRSGASNTRFNPNGSCRTVFTAGAALHTCITINDFHVFPIHSKYIVGTDIQAHTAAGAFLCVQLQGYDIFQINHASHFYTCLMIKDVTHAATPRIPAPISSGRANRISFFTPDSDVYVEHPVKFMAR